MQKPVVFVEFLAQKPLHAETLAGLQAELEAGFYLVFFCGSAVAVVSEALEAEAPGVALTLGRARALGL